MPATRGRPPKSTKVKERDGSFIHNPGRRPKNEPEPLEGTPDMPPSLRGDKGAQLAWTRVLGFLKQMKLDTLVDIELVELYALNHGKMLQAVKELKKEHDLPVWKKWHTQFDKACHAKMKLIPELGLSASSRTRLIARVEKDDDLLEEFLKASKN